ncbi:MAG: DUF5719 family protein [Acidimicrobiales bacterium]|jgi:hypothetical protein|nr:DUF5719 family protein [Acidimicrobiales bacterium]
MSRRVWRLPLLVLLPLLVVAAIAVQGDEVEPAPPPTDRVTPVALGADADGSTWYCAAGSATGVVSGDGAGTGEQVVVIANLSDRAVGGLFTVVPSEGASASEPIEVPAHTRIEVRASAIVVAPWASVVVELDGGEVAVEHALEGPGGRSVSPCASQPSPTWYFPAGTTRAGTTMLLALFNPFPGEASVDLSFETEDGTRTPQQFQGLVVPGGRVTVVDVSAVVTLRAQIATTVTARNGRIIAEQVLVSDGTDGSAVGLTSVLGAPAPALDWVFPELGPAAEGRTSTMAVLNPGDADAEVEVQVLLDDPAVNGTVEPFVLTVGPTSYGVVDLYADGRLPEGVGGWVMVRSTNGVPIVAERLDGGTEEADRPGLVAMVGAPVQAGRWIVPAASASSVEATGLVVVNPSGSRDVTVTVRADAGGTTQDLPGATSIVVPAGSRVVVPLGPEAVDLEGLSLMVEADGPVVVSRWFVLDGDLAESLGVPVVDTVSALLDLVRPEAFLPEAPVSEDVPVDAPLIDPAIVPPEPSATSATSTTEG